MAQDSARHKEIIDFIGKTKSEMPWPQIQNRLQARGFSADEIMAAVEEVFPGQKRPSQRRSLRAGLIGAAIGLIAWLLLAVLYHGSH
ncbi:MAG TPA: hypothetical protein DEB40_01725 [Elusimicrobia bacterium]|nr:hypothetical protein [Elusimicrobiota bacterium]HBT60449.1 hypothetical protein [Elusimicrobiota bacterium]